MASAQLSQKIATLRSLPTIRARCSLVHKLATEDKLEYFSYHPEKEKDVVEFCLGIMKRDYPDFNSIPAHGRWRHFDVNHERIASLLSSWSNVSVEEQCARLLDLFLVSVLLDAGAGNQWKYKEKETGEEYARSEGLAIASLDMFKEGLFSSDSSQPYRVDAQGLASLTEEKVATAMQVSEANPMSGISGRASLLTSLSTALRASPSYFGQEGRPGNLLHYLQQKMGSEASNSIHISNLWEVVILGLAPIWPTDRMSLGGVALGDVWKCDALAKQETEATSGDGSIGGGLVPFHKLSQWLTYSLVEPIEKLMGWKINGMQDMTGLPEYRNGGLLVDFGVLSLRPNVLGSQFYPDSSSNIPRVPPSHPAIIEWRAMTVIELDRIAAQICQAAGTSLTLPQILEAATWKGGREIAKKLRGGSGGGPPIEIESDGTVF